MPGVGYLRSKTRKKNETADKRCGKIFLPETWLQSKITMVEVQSTLNHINFKQHHVESDMFMAGEWRFGTSPDFAISPEYLVYDLYPEEGRVKPPSTPA
jgi:hypothetical protein